jgi:hypothetical protein
VPRYFIAVPLVEEPGLVQRFGTEYEEHRMNVPRRWPRVKGWEPAGNDRSLESGAALDSRRQKQLLDAQSPLVDLL